jgi:NAD(P)-dependent dehydrogenase (short-subunit alcohol dehydrogenase family)
MNWTAQDIPDQTGKTVIVTGANSGIGLETARVLSDKGATVILACRNIEKASEAKREIEVSVKHAKLEVIPLDLADLGSIQAFATTFTARHDHLHILINNAGVMIPPLTKTKDGFEVQFGGNHLGHFALTGLLLGLLRNTAKARLVAVCSVAERFGKIDFENLNAERQYDPMAAYGQSKLANMLFCYELGRRLQASGSNPLVAASHPGWTATNLQRNSANSASSRFLNKLFSQSPDMGALPSLYAATAPDVQNGDYFGPNGFLEMRGSPKKVKSSASSYNLDLAKKLWTISETLSGITFTW